MEFEVLLDLTQNNSVGVVQQRDDGGVGGDTLFEIMIPVGAFGNNNARMESAELMGAWRVRRDARERKRVCVCTPERETGSLCVLLLVCIFCCCCFYR